MAYELKEGQGSLFPNKRKETESHPNLTGTILVGGVEHWISGWVKLTADGAKWISLSVKPKEAKAAKPAAKAQKSEDFDSDEIPFN